MAGSWWTALAVVMSLLAEVAGVGPRPPTGMPTNAPTSLPTGAPSIVPSLTKVLVSNSNRFLGVPSVDEFKSKYRISFEVALSTLLAPHLIGTVPDVMFLSWPNYVIISCTPSGFFCYPRVFERSQQRYR